MGVRATAFSLACSDACRSQRGAFCLLAAVRLCSLSVLDRPTMKLPAMKNSRLFVLFVSCCPFVLAACGQGISDQPRVVRVSGVLTQKGNPVEGATVGFNTPGAPRAATGKTDADGKFQLSTFGDNDGAVPGEHVVTVIKLNPELQQKPEESADDYTTRMLGKNPSKSLLPQQYASPQSSPLKVTISADGPNENLELKIE